MEIREAKKVAIIIKNTEVFVMRKDLVKIAEGKFMTIQEAVIKATQLEQELDLPVLNIG